MTKLQLEHANEQIERLSAENVSLKAKIDRLEKTNHDYQEKFLALCMQPSNYARYLSERNIQPEERELKKMIDSQKKTDYEGLMELGLLSSDMPVVNIPEGAEK